MRERVLPGIAKLVEAEEGVRSSVPPIEIQPPTSRFVPERRRWLSDELEAHPEVQRMHETGRVPRFLRRKKSDSF